MRLPKIGWVKTAWSRDLEGRPVSCTVTRDAAGRYHACILCLVEDAEPLPACDSAVGVDLGVRTLMTCSDGVTYSNPRFAERDAAILAKAQRSLARKRGPRSGVRPSNRYLKQRRKLARIHARIADRRRDCIQKATTDLVRSRGTICMEDLNVEDIVANGHAGFRLIGDAAMAEVAREIEYKCGWYGRRLVKVNRFYPSSKRCSECGAVNKALLSNERWTCPSCGAEHDRDLNAAVNLLEEGMKIVGRGPSDADGLAG